MTDPRTIDGVAVAPPRFRIIHAVIGLELLAIGACFAVPALQEASVHRQAARAVHDMRQVAVAATEARAKLGQWPEDGTPGDVPTSLKRFLPARVTFEHGHYVLNWDHWRLSDGSGENAQTSEFAGVSVITNDERLLGLITDQLGTQKTHFTLGNRTIFMVSDPGMATP